MNILLCTLGASWAVIPEIFGWLAPDGEADALGRMQAKYPTSGLAVITFDIARFADVAPGLGRLEAFVSPKTLP